MNSLRIERQKSPNLGDENFDEDSARRSRQTITLLATGCGGSDE